jgi:two-component system, OmpR family, phosphate regulon sensor histidine kinase PhoR
VTTGVHDVGGVEAGDGARRRSGLSPFRIVALYAVFGAAWILLSDRVVALLVTDDARRQEVQSLKGALYVLVTAALLYVLIHRSDRARRVLDAEVRAVLDGMADAVLVFDAAGNAIDANPAAVALFGARHRRELLMPLVRLSEVAHVRRPDGTPFEAEGSVIERALAGQVVSSYEARLRAFDGREVLVGVTAGPVAAGAPGLAAPLAVLVLRDVGEVRRFEEMREEFLATAAHELRTPLAVVKAYAQLMRKRGQGDAVALDVIARQIDRLTRIVQQVTEVSRFRLGDADLRPERFDLSALLLEVAQAMRACAEGRRIAVADGAGAGDGTGAEVLADRDRIRQVITSLIENAVRFSPQGGDVEAAVARSGAEAVVSIRDHGLGIAPDRQARIFERFYRAHAGTSQDYGGLGIGLDMSREIVSRHGGRIWFESAPGVGSTFSFALPLAARDAR